MTLFQTEREDVPVLLVGGGSILVDCDVPLKGASKVIKPPDHWVRSKFTSIPHTVLCSDKIDGHHLLCKFILNANV